MKLIIQIRKPWPSQNEFDGYHWSKKNKARKQAEEEIFADMVESGAYRQWLRAGRPFFREVNLYRVGRIADRGNLIGGAKKLIDALVNTGLLEDDSDDKVRVTYYQGGKHDRTILNAINFKASMGTNIVLSAPERRSP